jgi:hypothetical protein
LSDELPTGASVTSSSTSGSSANKDDILELFAGAPQQSNDDHLSGHNPSSSSFLPSTSLLGSFASVSSTGSSKPSDDLLVLAGNGRALHSLSGPSFDRSIDFSSSLSGVYSNAASAAAPHVSPNPFSSFSTPASTCPSLSSASFAAPLTLQSNAVLHAQFARPQPPPSQPAQTHLLTNHAFAAGLNPFGEVITGQPSISSIHTSSAASQPSSAAAAANGRFEPNFNAAFGAAQINGSASGKFAFTLFDPFTFNRPSPVPSSQSCPIDPVQLLMFCLRFSSRRFTFSVCTFVCLHFSFHFALRHTTNVRSIMIIHTNNSKTKDHPRITNEFLLKPTLFCSKKSTATSSTAAEPGKNRYKTVNSSSLSILSSDLLLYLE